MQASPLWPIRDLIPALEIFWLRVLASRSPSRSSARWRPAPPTWLGPNRALSPARHAHVLVKCWRATIVSESAPADRATLTSGRSLIGPVRHASQSHVGSDRTVAH